MMRAPRIDMVAILEIDTVCEVSCPCIHLVEITLQDGRRKKGSILGDDIFVLVNSIEKEKIKGDYQHFQCYEDRSFFASKNYLYSTPEQILADFFRGTFEEESV